MSSVRTYSPAVVQHVNMSAMCTANALPDDGPKIYRTSSSLKSYYVHIYYRVSVNSYRFKMRATSVGTDFWKIFQCYVERRRK